MTAVALEKTYIAEVTDAEQKLQINNCNDLFNCTSEITMLSLEEKPSIREKIKVFIFAALLTFLFLLTSTIEYNQIHDESTSVHGVEYAK